MHQFKVSSNSIASMGSLASGLNLSREQLNKALTIPAESRYVEVVPVSEATCKRSKQNPRCRQINRKVGNDNELQDYAYL